MEISARNQLRGRVTAIKLGSVMAQVSLQVGCNEIGAALARRFAAEGARAVVVVDLDLAGAEAVAAEIRGLAFKADVGVEGDLVRVVHETEARFGRIDLWCSNAGIFFIGGVETPDA